MQSIYHLDISKDTVQQMIKTSNIGYKMIKDKPGREEERRADCTVSGHTASLTILFVAVIAN